LPAGRLIVLAGLAASVRWIGTGLTDTLPAIAVLQALHGISFGAAHLGAMHWIGRQVPPALSATAQSLYSAIVFGLFLGAMLYGGCTRGSRAPRTCRWRPRVSSARRAPGRSCNVLTPPSRHPSQQDSRPQRTESSHPFFSQPPRSVCCQ
jgi:hypothetical protein